MNQRVQVRVPASSANLGPGFDCMALALDIWNEVEFTRIPQGVQLEVNGEGVGQIPLDETNLIVRAALVLYEKIGLIAPGMRITCHNGIPINGGLGSSAAAILAGLLGANALAGNPLTEREVLNLAADMEGHPDNVAAALYGGLVVVISKGTTFLPVKFDLPELRVALVLPDVCLPTKVARAVLPRQIALSDAVFNMGRVALVVQALQRGDMALLQEVMEDRLHQPYRLKLIAGAEQAMQAAYQAGAAAVVLSGAGPSLIAFPRSGDPTDLADALVRGFSRANVKARGWVYSAVFGGASTQILAR